MNFQTEENLNQETGLTPWTKEYQALPGSIKSFISLKEYAWLSDVEKKNLIQSECEPEF